jgi:hypothetical protein
MTGEEVMPQNVLQLAKAVGTTGPLHANVKLPRSRGAPLERFAPES